MEYKNFFEDRYITFINEVLSKEEYLHIRTNADRLLEYDELEFAHNFDYTIAKSDIFPFEIIDPFTEEKIQDATEYIFLYYIHYKSMRAHLILEDYMEHCDITNKEVSNELEDYHEANFSKGQFIHLKLKRATSAKEVSSLKRSVKGLQKPIKKPQQNTLKGKKLNLLERYEIANKVFNIDNQIRTLHIPEAEKDKLLSLILDCNTTNARHIMNGKYQGKIRQELISEYIQTLKK